MIIESIARTFARVVVAGQRTEDARGGGCAELRALDASVRPAIGNHGAKGRA
jgi:hypothetical protein